MGLYLDFFLEMFYHAPEMKKERTCRYLCSSQYTGMCTYAERGLPTEANKANMDDEEDCEGFLSYVAKLEDALKNDECAYPEQLREAIGAIKPLFEKEN